MPLLKSKPKNQLEAKKEIGLKLGKIWSLINNMAQERRINSEELDDFNQAFRKLSDNVNAVITAFESMELEASGVDQMKQHNSEKLQKMEICLELCGMSKKGIDDMMNFPIEFLETVLAIRMKHGKPLETDIDFMWVDLVWRDISLQIDIDLDSFKQANFLKSLYYKATGPKQKEITIRMMNGYAEDLEYLRLKLGKEIDEKELMKIITTHWHEIYRHNTSI